MKHFVALAGLASALLFAVADAAAADPSVPPLIAAAVANPDRPQDDRDRDANRKPVEDLAFAGVRPGWKVADFIPGTGYFSRILSGAVGPKGHVYAFVPTELTHFLKITLPPNGVAPYPAFKNVTTVVAPVNNFSAPEPLDLVWISDNYHDLHDPFFAPADLAVINKAVFEALRPGGVYLVIDHRAPPGSGLSDTNSLHRIDEAAVKAEVEAAGFTLVGESDALHNPSDPLTARIFDPSIRGKTDQFILKFRKPGA
jgi:predicted methyltransferase